MYTQPVLAIVVAVLLAVLFAAFMYSAHGPMDGQRLAIFEWVPEELIHTTGIAVMIAVFLAGLAGMWTIVRSVGRREGIGWRSVIGSRDALSRTSHATWVALGREALGQTTFRKECAADPESRAMP